ncbi:uncharacterized protein LOC117189778 [Drosophila miranda]|uniref:uncharacterized protein LOC117189778 n=1 Tax=Drosophila miranda TaxID=7229 RepID=UPI00143F2A4D|nr:uncharacterized protein LOC117189778 [Drosophila miranda]
MENTPHTPNTQIEKMTEDAVFGRRNALTRSPPPSAPAKAQGSSMFKPGPDGKEKERPHSDPLELLKNLGTRANELVKRMNDQRHVDNVMKDLALRVVTLQALVVKNFEKLHTRTIETATTGTQTAAKPPHTGSKRLRESPQMAAEPTKRQRGTKLQQASTQLKPPAQSQDELTPSGTVDHGATPAAKKQLKWQQVGPRGELSYSDILRMVTRRQDGKLQEVGDNVNRIRRTAKGELLLELNGASKSNTAKLKEDISAALGLQTGIRAVSEELCVEVRDLDSLVEKEDIAAAIAASIDAPSVDTSAIKSLRPSFAGTQLAVVCLPPVQARALLMVGKLKVGWTSCRIRERTAQRRCYRCLEFGHLAIRCKSAVDRTGCCLRCGVNGHKAATCQSDPRCFICTANNSNETNHYAGSRRCPAARSVPSLPAQ